MGEDRQQKLWLAAYCFALVQRALLCHVASISTRDMYYPGVFLLLILSSLLFPPRAEVFHEERLVMNDHEAMRHALSCARSVEGRTSPRPPVGALVVRDGVITGQGATAPPYGPHAEIQA